MSAPSQIDGRIAAWLHDAWRARSGPLAVGLCGAQGSGKSTLAAQLRDSLQRRGLRVATLSLDDLYLRRAARLRMAAAVHPLFATRGVPGTHDLGLGAGVLDGLLAGRSLRLPSFDKGLDDRRPDAEGAWLEGPADIVVFEGWCVGARPQTEGALAAPVNALERVEDSAATWRTTVNAALRAYQPLFARLDLLVLLRAPSFEVVAGWRAEQEADLRAAARDASQAMDADAIARFVQHFERLTRHILEEMPHRADLVVKLGEARRSSADPRRRRPLNRRRVCDRRRSRRPTRDV